MAETTSFGWLVVGKSIADTKSFFGSTRRDIALTAISVGGGFAAYWYFKGLPVAMEEALSVAAFTFGPLGFVLVAVFLWNLWLAPAALAYEASGAGFMAASRSEPNTPTEKPINWAIWKQRTSYNLEEFAAILAKVEPSRSGKSADRVGFLELLKEDAMKKRLRVSASRLAEDYQKPDIYPSYWDVSRSDAIQWAKGKNFDVSHIE